MGTQDGQPDSGNDIPEDAMVVKQVQYAWLWSSMPWVLALAVLFYIGIIPEPIFASVLILIIVVPRYLIWRGTAYILAEDTLIYQRGGITGSTKYQIPLSKLTDVRLRSGNFGRMLGYQAVDILLEDGVRASLAYLPVPNDVEGYIRERMDASPGTPKDGQHGDDEEESSDQPGTYDPDASKYDPDEAEHDPDGPPQDKPPGS